jgi:hypothetical protein
MMIASLVFGLWFLYANGWTINLIDPHGSKTRRAAWIYHEALAPCC